MMDYLNAKSRGGQTPLHVASMCGKDEVIVKLLALGANINARDYYGKGPLSWRSLTLFTIGGGAYGPPPHKLTENLVRAEGPGFGHL